MSYKILEGDSENPMYVFSSFWDFVFLCVHLKPGYTLRAYLYAVVGWGIGMCMGILATEVTRQWIIAQAVILLVILAACSVITYWSLRKEWDYLRSTNLVRTVPREGKSG